MAIVLTPPLVTNNNPTMIRESFFLFSCSVLFVTVGLPKFNAFLRLARPDRIKSRFEDDEFDPGLFSRPVRDIIDSLRSIGFRVLGVKVEEPPMGGAVRSLALEAAEEKVFASIIALERANPVYYFLTPFLDGAMVLTSSQEKPQPVKTATFVNQGFKNLPMDELLAVHLKTVDTMVKAGHQPFDKYTRESRIQSTDMYYAHPDANILQRRLRSKLLGGFASTLGLLLLAISFLVYRLLFNRALLGG
jgi:hypothetical protein